MGGLPVKRAYSLQLAAAVIMTAALLKRNLSPIVLSLARNLCAEQTVIMRTEISRQSVNQRGVLDRAESVSMNAVAFSTQQGKQAAVISSRLSPQCYQTETLSSRPVRVSRAAVLSSGKMSALNL